MEGAFYLIHLCGQTKFCAGAARPAARSTAEENAVARPPAFLVFRRRAALPQPGQQAGGWLFFYEALALRLGPGLRSGGKTSGAGTGGLERLHVLRLRVGPDARRTDRGAALPVPILLPPEFPLRRRSSLAGSSHRHSTVTMRRTYSSVPRRHSCRRPATTDCP